MNQAIMQITWSVLSKLGTKNIEKRRKHSQSENLIDSLVHFMTKTKDKAQISPTLPWTLNKRYISGILVNNKAPVSVVSDKCV